MPGDRTVSTSEEQFVNVAPRNRSIINAVNEKVGQGPLAGFPELEEFKARLVGCKTILDSTTAADAHPKLHGILEDDTKIYSVTTKTGADTNEHKLVEVDGRVLCYDDTLNLQGLNRAFDTNAFVLNNLPISNILLNEAQEKLNQFVSNFNQLNVEERQAIRDTLKDASSHINGYLVDHENNDAYGLESYVNNSRANALNFITANFKLVDHLTCGSLLANINANISNDNEQINNTDLVEYLKRFPNESKLIVEHNERHQDAAIKSILGLDGEDKIERDNIKVITLKTADNAATATGSNLGAGVLTPAKSSDTNAIKPNINFYTNDIKDHPFKGLDTYEVSVGTDSTLTLNLDDLSRLSELVNTKDTTNPNYNTLLIQAENPDLAAQLSLALNLYCNFDACFDFDTKDPAAIKLIADKIFAVVKELQRNLSPYLLNGEAGAQCIENAIDLALTMKCHELINNPTADVADNANIVVDDDDDKQQSSHDSSLSTSAITSGDDDDDNAHLDDDELDFQPLVDATPTAEVHKRKQTREQIDRASKLNAQAKAFLVSIRAALLNKLSGNQQIAAQRHSNLFQALQIFATSSMEGARKEVLFFDPEVIQEPPAKSKKAQKTDDTAQQKHNKLSELWQQLLDPKERLVLPYRLSSRSALKNTPQPQGPLDDQHDGGRLTPSLDASHDKNDDAKPAFVVETSLEKFIDRYKATFPKAPITAVCTTQQQFDAAGDESQTAIFFETIKSVAEYYGYNSSTVGFCPRVFSYRHTPEKFKSATSTSADGITSTDEQVLYTGDLQATHTLTLKCVHLADFMSYVSERLTREDPNSLKAAKLSTTLTNLDELIAKDRIDETDDYDTYKSILTNLEQITNIPRNRLDKWSTPASYSELKKEYAARYQEAFGTELFPSPSSHSNSDETNNDDSNAPEPSRSPLKCNLV